MKTIEGGVCAAQGFTAAGVHCGIRKNKTKRDLALIYADVSARLCRPGMDARDRMSKLADRLEELTPAERWPFPVYSDLLFSV